MRIINVCGENVEVYGMEDFPYHNFENVRRVERGRKKCINVPCAFDIETTTIKQEEAHDYGFMYIWQFCIDGTVCVGRTWEEYQIFINRLKRAVGAEYGCNLIVYVHFLQFEFQFMRNFFKVEKVFARDKRDVVYAIMEDVEYRCSYALSNMSLDKFLKNTKGVKVRKLDGKEFDYGKIRTANTELTDKEMEYCVADVLGLVEAIRSKMEDDDLLSIPMTSTGYVRRDFREVCLEQEGYKRHMLNIKLNARTYLLCKEACRGGISGSNALNTGWTIDNVDSFDIKSSYPYQMMTKYFPQSKFLKVTCEFDTSKFWKFLTKKCCLIVWSCENIKLKHWESIPYISKAKCRAIQGGNYGNGKVYMAKRLGMCCTEIDFEIIMDSYTFENVKIHEMYVADRGMLAKPFRKKLAEMFQMKTDLEDGDPYLYAKYKNKINASFGMMLTDILNPDIIYNANSELAWVEEKNVDIEKKLAKYYYSNNSFLSYQHGIYVTAHARKSLYEGMKIVGHNIVQVDTDSVKTIGNFKKQFQKINNRIMKEAESFDVKPYAIKNGEKVYLGIWEHENDKYAYTYKEFKTLGAKKYMDIKSGKDTLEITVAGLRKGASDWFMSNGGFDAFEKGTIVPPEHSGRTSSTYNDWAGIKQITIDGCTMSVGSNIGIRNTSYTVGITDEWEEMIEGIGR